VKVHDNALLTVHGLCKRHGERTLFEIDTLEIEAASAYVLTGVNGAGKSTLLRTLAGLERCDACTVQYEGRSMPLHPYPKALRQAIVYVHQHPIMFSTSVFHNIAYGLLARGDSRSKVAPVVEEAMAWAGVLHLRDTEPAQLAVQHRGERPDVGVGQV